MAAAKPIFSKLLKGLIALPIDAGEDERLKPFHVCIHDLNCIEDNEEVENCIDTEEREFFCELLKEIASLAGLVNSDKFLCKREW